MEQVKTKGIVIAETRAGEYDKMLTVFTDSLGLIHVSAKGASSRRNNLKAAARVFCYSEFTLYRKQSDIYTISEVNPLADFLRLSENLERFQAAGRFLKYIRHVAVENEDSGNLLRLLLNSLHMLANTDKSLLLIQCVFYLQSLVCLGIPPELEECTICGTKDSLTVFAPEDGGILCTACGNYVSITYPVTELQRQFLFAAEALPLPKAFGMICPDSLMESCLEYIQEFIKIHLSFSI